MHIDKRSDQVAMTFEGPSSKWHGVEWQPWQTELCVYEKQLAKFFPMSPSAFVEANATASTLATKKATLNIARYLLGTRRAARSPDRHG